MRGGNFHQVIPYGIGSVLGYGCGMIFIAFFFGVVGGCMLASGGF